MFRLFSLMGIKVIWYERFFLLAIDHLLRKRMPYTGLGLNPKYKEKLNKTYIPAIG